MFTIDEHINYKGHYKLVLDMSIYDTLTEKGPLNTSFNILPARLLGLEYHEFLSYIKQDYGAELHGKTGRYIHYSFSNKKLLQDLICELNKRWEYVIS